jgi:hypothetical protein
MDKIRQETERKVRNVATKVTATVVKWVYGVDHQLEQPVSKVGPGVEHGDAAVRGPATKTGLCSSADWTTKWRRRGLSTECTELKQSLSGVHSIMRVKIARAGDGGGCTPTPFHYIYHHQ